AGAIKALLTIEGVEGIGQPVTVLTLGDLPPEFLGFVERLRGGGIEVDEEMVVITLANSQRRRRTKEPARERFRQALLLLCRYATEKGVPAAAVATLLDEAKRKLSPQARKSKDPG
ncbi:MAG: hypothetical protein L0Z62_07865, partial [Gemmataceae bacterium]|nr:hypothetical protein [Gemmataceae bacterium]